MEVKITDATKVDGSSRWTAVWTRGHIWVLNVLLLATAFSLGWWMHSGARVQAAQSAGDLLFQLTGMHDANALVLYYPEQKSIYVYQAIESGNSLLGCRYRFELGKPGAPITRHICPITEMK